MKRFPAYVLAAALAMTAGSAYASESCRVPKDGANEGHTHCGGATASTHAHGAVYKATGSVKSVDKAAGRVIIAHHPVAALNWPAMTMRFGVSDKALLDELAAGREIDFRFVQRGTEYIVTALY